MRWTNCNKSSFQLLDILTLLSLTTPDTSGRLKTTVVGIIDNKMERNLSIFRLITLYHIKAQCLGLPLVQ